MNYAPCTGMEETISAGQEIAGPVQSLAEIMKETSSLAVDVLSMSHRINSFLFDTGDKNCEKEEAPRCFREELLKTRCELLAACEELARLCNMLGL